ncbi:hypothetical protein SDC9_57636 [bioreactor metagenome]|uniref:Uncharacterized protein n=1 Tax=bioreactor metagenome TaxID=1076179 RepID=A0A644XAX2_9ZZZZ
MDDFVRFLGSGIRHQESKLIATDAGKNVSLSAEAFENLRGLFNDSISCIIAKRIVNQLETVDISHQNRQREMLFTVEHVFRRFVVHTVEEPCQIIMIAEVLNLQKLPLGFRDIDDNAFQRFHIAFAVVNALIDLEHPLALSVCSHDFVFIPAGTFFINSALTLFPNILPVFRANDLVERNSIIINQIFRIITRQRITALRDKFHRPFLVEQTPVGNPLQVCQ